MADISRRPRTRARLFFGLAVILALLAAERLLSASLLGFVRDESRSLRLAVSFLCAGLAPLLLGLGLLARRQGRARDD